MNEIICPYCGQQNPADSKFCTRCAAMIAQPQQATPPPQPEMLQQQYPPQQAYYAPPPQQPYAQPQPVMMPPPPAKSKAPMIIAVVIAIVAIVAIATVAIVLMASSGAHDLNVGDYIEWSYTGTSLFSGYSGKMKMTVTGETDTTYTITISYTGDFYLPSESFTFSKKETVADSGAFGELGTFVGVETISTSLGTRTCKHYSTSESGYDFDYWIGSSNGMLYKMVMSSNVGDLIFELSDTNIGWI